VPPAYRGKADEKEWLAGYDAPPVTTSGEYPAGNAPEAVEPKADKKA
jgi:hypothetical protein